MLVVGFKPRLLDFQFILSHQLMEGLSELSRQFRPLTVGACDRRTFPCNAISPIVPTYRTEGSSLAYGSQALASPVPLLYSWGPGRGRGAEVNGRQELRAYLSMLGSP